MISMKMLQEWLEYTSEVDSKNRDILNHNKRIKNQVDAEITHYNTMMDRYDEKLREWSKRGWRDYFEEQPISPDKMVSMKKIESLEHQFKGTIYPDFTGFMNYMVKEKGMLDGRK